MFKAGLSVVTFLFLVVCGYSQPFVISGVVTDAATQEPMPFVSVGIKGTSIGQTTDFEGKFLLKCPKPPDTLVVSYLGYQTRYIKLTPGRLLQLNILMFETSTEMKEAVIKAGINPALRIVNNASKLRKLNTQDNLNTYEFTSYNKVDLSMNNISKKMMENKLLAPVKSLFDSANQMQNEDGLHILPVFVSETQSNFYYLKKPYKTKEVILASYTAGLGVAQESYLTELMGASLLQFNFNEDYLRMVYKDFVSPIASACHTFYWYTLTDSVDIDGLKCYEIRIQPKRETDLAFTGTMWIADSSFAIRRITVDIPANANLNYVKKLKIQQEQLPTPSGPWFPNKTRVIIETSRITENSGGFVSKMYRANTNLKTNHHIPETFFDVPIVRSEKLLQHDTTIWDSIRTEKLSANELLMREKIDSVNNLRAVRMYTDVARVLFEGYYRYRGIDFGPYLFLLNYNQVEGFRTRIGFRTNRFFSERWYYNGYVAYGFSDEKFKYGGGVEYVFPVKRWTTLGAYFKNDYDILSVTNASAAPIYNFGSGGSNAFAALNMGSSLARINQTIDYRGVLTKQLNRDWTIRVGANNTYFKPLGNFDFEYMVDPELGASDDNLKSDFTYTAISVDVRFAYKELLIPKGNQRVRFKLATAPVTTLSYQRGFKGLLGGEFNFDKISLNFNQHLTTGWLGNADYSVTAGKIFGTLPYPILEVMRGNNSFIYSDNNFSLMNMYEFVADEYIQGWYVQHFEGLFFNRVPLFKKWKLRNYALAKGAIGRLSAANRSIYTTTEDFNINNLTFSKKPYLEVGYGIENIFRLISLGVVHRLTYLNHTNQNIRTWGINAGIVLQF